LLSHLSNSNAIYVVVKISFYIPVYIYIKTNFHCYGIALYIAS
jgi:hypothetical protein